ncbi:hypothetical protein QBC34DRAFT_445137 [Podospora aff. communis PSN243]|uniref:Reverse transcriptase domain-containing protein n=1 Tax=Podospora aff. communis PSN243 TaxID=3040156 RepID=A0AAV9H6N8_9PEZI|nr:hypothetical protein QBC34DRAFT_445137 [Podospora aff. communis PSN243]
MASPTSLLSKTLHSITLTKIRELESRRKSYETRKREFLDKANAQTDPRDCLACLLDAFKELYPSASKDHSLSNIERWLAQSRYDAAIPASKLVSFGDHLRGKLDIQSRKLDMADLYSRLLTEWMDQPATDPLENLLGDDDAETFEVLAERQRQRLSELVDKFEAVVFEPKETSPTDIHKFLDDLFTDEASQDALETLREEVATASEDLMSETTPFDEESLTSCIKGLLTEDIFSDEKQAILRDFLESKAAKAEIADVLNMRFSDLKQWHWDVGKDGIRVMPRAGLNGKYRIWADDDILQLIFVQYIGVKLCNMLKPSLKQFMLSVWEREIDSHLAPSQDEQDRRRYFLDSYYYSSSGGTVEHERKQAYMDTFLLSQLPDTETSLLEGDHNYDGNDDTSSASSEGLANQKRPHTKELIIHRLRGKTYDTRTDSGNGVALVQTDLQWYGTSLSHSTIFAVLEYVGFGEDWVAFFRKYLAAPLNLDTAADGRPQLGPRIRKRGVPMAHASEKFIGELVLFFMDVAVNRQTGILLYRLHDDIWLCGEPERSAQAWTCLQPFSDVFGLEFNRSKTGSVHLPGSGKKDVKVAKILPVGNVSIGFLQLSPETGKWVIDRRLVKAHLDQLEKQLLSCKSILSWVQTWNSCIGRFFSHTFGEPAFCLGCEHVDEVLNTYSKMLERLFPNKDGGSVVKHLKEMIQDRFDVKDLPDAFIFLPENLGGLGLRDPFVPLFLIRDRIRQTPEAIIESALRRERERYLEEKKMFDEVGESGLRRRFRSIYPDDDHEVAAIKADELDTFMSLEEYSRFREKTSYQLRDAYMKLVSTPDIDDIVLSKEVESGIRDLGAFVKGSLDSEKKWFLQLYSEELLKDFGGLSLVDKQFLPVGVLAMMRGKKVTWQMVL